LKNTTPEDISRTAVPHVKYLLEREAPVNKLKAFNARLRSRVETRVRGIKERTGRKGK
jgi:hypothetical protein